MDQKVRAVTVEMITDLVLHRSMLPPGPGTSGTPREEEEVDGLYVSSSSARVSAHRLYRKYVINVHLAARSESTC